MDARKVDKPKVARAVVKKILSEDFADSPVRFLKRVDDGFWVQVDKNEAACKVSQALREKTRWSCMKSDEAHTAASLKLDMDHLDDTPTKKRRSFNGTDEAKSLNVVKALKVETTDKETGDTSANKIQIESPSRQAGRLIQIGNPPVQQPVLATAPPILVPEFHSVQQQEFQAHAYETNALEIKPITIPAVVPVLARIFVPPLEVATATAMFPNDGSMPTDADVLFGRGGRTNHHPGNKRLRMIVDHYKVAYAMARKTEKPRYAKAIVQALRVHTTPSRFLRMNEKTNEWEDVGDRRAAEKVSQTLREKEKTIKGKSEITAVSVASPGVMV